MTFVPSRRARKIAYSATTVLPLDVGALTRTPPTPVSSLSIASPWNGSSLKGRVASKSSTRGSTAFKSHQLSRHVGDPRPVRVRLDIPESGSQHLVGVPAVGADAGDGELGQLPAVALADLGGRHLELRPDAAQQAAHDLALALQ